MQIFFFRWTHVAIAKVVLHKQNVFFFYDQNAEDHKVGKKLGYAMSKQYFVTLMQMTIYFFYHRLKYTI